MLLFTWASFATGQESASRAIPLREQATVKGETIRLSDLLPANAPSALRSAAASLELARAPLPGSVRVLIRQQIVARLAGEDGIRRQLSIPAQILVERRGWQIGENTILAAVSNFLEARGSRQTTTPESVEWSEGVTMRDEDPKLQVTGAEFGPEEHVLDVRMRCADRSLCGSFLTRIAIEGASGNQLTTTEVISQLPRPSQASLQVARSKQSGLQLVRRGASAQLTLEGDGVQILLPVICLQPGGLGDQVLVRAEGRRVFPAQVVAPGQLQAAF